MFHVKHFLFLLISENFIQASSFFFIASYIYINIIFSFLSKIFQVKHRLFLFLSKKIHIGYFLFSFLIKMFHVKHSDFYHIFSFLYYTEARYVIKLYFALFDDIISHKKYIYYLHFLFFDCIYFDFGL